MYYQIGSKEVVLTTGFQRYNTAQFPLTDYQSANEALRQSGRPALTDLALKNVSLQDSTARDIKVTVRSKLGHSYTMELRAGEGYAMTMHPYSLWELEAVALTSGTDKLLQIIIILRPAGDGGIWYT